jgi:hypothetical protein
MFRRHKRLVAKWYEPGGALYKGPPIAAGTAPTGNVMAPAPSSTPVYYYMAPPQQGAPYISPQATGVTSIPGTYGAPVSVPSDRGISPLNGPSSGISPGQSPATHQSYPVNQSPGTQAAQPLMQTQTVPYPGTHEMQ